MKVDTLVLEGDNYVPDSIGRVMSFIGKPIAEVQFETGLDYGQDAEIKERFDKIVNDILDGKYNIIILQSVYSGRSLGFLRIIARNLKHRKEKITIISCSGDYLTQALNSISDPSVCKIVSPFNHIVAVTNNEIWEANIDGNCDTGMYRVEFDPSIGEFIRNKQSRHQK